MIPTEVEERQQDVDRAVFFSFGMFIIDEIEYLPPNPSKPKLTNLPGGAGLYALLGARLLSPPPTSRHLKWLLDAGSDFPSSITFQLNTWTTGTIIRVDDSRLTTRAWNGYGHNDPNSSTASESRAFKYLTPKRRLDVIDLPDAWVSSRSWHMVCSAARCLEIVKGIDVRRESLGLNSHTHHNKALQKQHDDNNNHEGNFSSKDRGIVIWEPIPDLCTPEELNGLREVVQSGKVDVMSPNLEELGLYFRDRDGHLPPGMSAEAMAYKAMGWNNNDLVDDTTSVQRGYSNAVCVVREGADGSTIYFPPSTSTLPPPSSTLPTTISTISQIDITNASTNTNPHPPSKPRKLHLPAYHTSSTAHLVTDPTGGGNTYLGALACSLAYTIPWFSTTSSISFPSSKPITTPTARTTEPSSSPPPPILKAILFTESHSQSLANSCTSHEKAFLAAGICACVAASFAIQQSGVPELYVDTDGEGNGNEDGGTKDEAWGLGRSGVCERVDWYIARLRDGDGFGFGVS